MKRVWKKLNSKIVYKNKWIKIYEDSVLRPDKKQGIYAYLSKSPANFIVAVDKQNNIYFVKEHRYPINKTIIQLPAGVVEGKNVLAQAKKELFEETGLKARSWKRLGKYYVAPGHDSTHVNVYLAKDLNLKGLKTSNQEGDEAIQQVLKFSEKEVKKLLVSEKIQCGITIAALNLYFLNK